MRANQEISINQKCIENVQQTLLDLSEKNIGDEDISIICTFINTHPEIKELRLDKNQIGNDGAIILADMLVANTTLLMLNLDHNNIDNKGICTLGEALANNDSLRRLDFFVNHFDISTGFIVATFLLKNNFTITQLSCEKTYQSLPPEHHEPFNVFKTTLKTIESRNRRLIDHPELIQKESDSPETLKLCDQISEIIANLRHTRILKLAKNKKWLKILDILLHDRKKITMEEINAQDDEGENTLSLLLKQHQWDLIDLLIDYKLINKSNPHFDWLIISLVIGNSDYYFRQDTAMRNLIDQCCATGKKPLIEADDPYFEPILRTLLRHRQYGILRSLVSNGTIQSKHLSLKNDQGENILFTLSRLSIKEDFWAKYLIEDFLSYRLITSEHLSDLLLFSFSLNYWWEIIDKLLNQNLLTMRQFSYEQHNQKRSYITSLTRHCLNRHHLALAQKLDDYFLKILKEKQTTVDVTELSFLIENLAPIASSIELQQAIHCLLNKPQQNKIVLLEKTMGYLAPNIKKQEILNAVIIEELNTELKNNNVGFIDELHAFLKKEEVKKFLALPPPQKTTWFFSLFESPKESVDYWSQLQNRLIEYTRLSPQ